MKPIQLLCLTVSLCLSSVANGQLPAPRLALIPPSPFTDKTTIDIRGAVENPSDHRRTINLSLYLDRESPSTLLRTQSKQGRLTQALRFPIAARRKDGQGITALSLCRNAKTRKHGWRGNCG